jgi:zinc transport system permease protein
VASGLGVVFTIAGLWLSYAFNLTSGATIILVSGGGYVLSFVVKSIQRSTQQRLSQKEGDGK